MSLINCQKTTLNLKKPTGFTGQSQNPAEDDVTDVGHQDRRRNVLAVPFMNS